MGKHNYNKPNDDIFPGNISSFGLFLLNFLAYFKIRNKENGGVSVVVSVAIEEASKISQYDKRRVYFTKFKGCQQRRLDYICQALLPKVRLLILCIVFELVLKFP